MVGERLVTFDDTITAPVRPKPAPAGDRGRVAAIVVVAVVVLVAGLVSAVSPAKRWYPSSWDPRIAPIASAVEGLRHLSFEHPVPVIFLEPSEFEKRLGVDDSSAAAADVRDEAGELRAFGLLDGNVDLAKAVNQSESSGTLAFYDPSTKEVIVRGDTFDVAHRVTVAHELTHVLQDQHFDLTKLQARAERSDSGDPSALTALIEGDATHIEDEYRDDLSAADRRAYDRENSDEGDRVGNETADVPEIVQLEMGAPYILGPRTIDMLEAEGGSGAIDKALTGPTPAARTFVEPGVLEAPAAPDPVLPAGALRLGYIDPLTSFDLYLVLAARIDRPTALAGADAMAAGRIEQYRMPSAAQACTQAVLLPSSAAEHPVLLQSLRAWGAAIPNATIVDGADKITVTACDPGLTAKGPTAARLDSAVQYLTVREDLTVTLAQQGASGDLSRCAARLFMRRASLVQLFVDNPDFEPSAAQAAAIRAGLSADILQCRGTDDAPTA